MPIGFVQGLSHRNVIAISVFKRSLLTRTIFLCLFAALRRRSNGLQLHLSVHLVHHVHPAEHSEDSWLCTIPSCQQAVRKYLWSGARRQIIVLLGLFGMYKTRPPSPLSCRSISPNPSSNGDLLYRRNNIYNIQTQRLKQFTFVALVFNLL